MGTKSLGLVAAVVLTMAAFTFGPGVQAEDAMLDVEIVVAPNVVYMASQGVWVTVHADIAWSTVVASEVTLNDLPVKVAFADNRGDLVAKFPLDSVKEILVEGEMVLTLKGTTLSGQDFEGTDTIRVIAARSKK